MIQTKQPYVMRHPQAIAWLVVLMGFAVFCGICLSVTLFSYWFLFSSHVGMNVSLTVSRGVMNVTYPDGTDTSTYNAIDAIDPNFKLTTIDNSSQGYLSFKDNYSGQLIASVHILADSSVTVGQGDRPRFEWSSSAYVILLNNVTGHFVVDLTRNITRPIDLTLRSGLGEAHFSQAGIYNVDFSDSVIHLTPTESPHYDLSDWTSMIDTLRQEMIDAIRSEVKYISLGTIPDLSAWTQMINIPLKEAIAELRTSTGQTKQVSLGSQVTIVAGQPIALQPVPFEVLNPNFGKVNLDQPNVLLNLWACNNKTHDDNDKPKFPLEPLGSFKRGIDNDEKRIMVNMSRQGSPELGHAETSCQFVLVPDDPLPFTFNLLDGGDFHYDSLSIRAEFRINSHNVSACGVQGSECPLMLELTYLGEGNTPDNPAVWRHGFYAFRTPNDLSPSSCDTCSQEHEKISQDAWYIYDSGDLLKLLPDAKKPQQLIQVRIYASGHLYDVDISDLQVIAGVASPAASTTP